MHTNGLERKKKSPITALDDGSALAKLMRAFYAELVSDAFVDANGDGLAVAFSLDNPFVQTVLSSLAKNVRDVAQTTKDEIAALVGKQAELGWDMERLAKEIRAKGAIASVTRSVTIARSESAAAYSKGSIAAWKASGVVDRKTWLIGPDSCPECVALDGMTVGIDEEFAPGVDAPPFHPRCVCAISAVLKD